MNHWMRKLAAYLHDPPEKAYDFGPRHLERAQHHAANLGVAELWASITGQPDWSAAAADRFVFPHGSKIGESLGGSIEFVHPFSGRAIDGRPCLEPNDFPSQADAERILDDTLPAFSHGELAVRFFHVWRLWLHHAVTHHSGQQQKAGAIAYLPADTRIPDASIWHHLSIVSALETTRGADDVLHPAFLLFQLGPVQDFIAQARSTRDLWSGSYLLSWMMAHVIKKLADELGPDCVIFPNMRGQPLYDWLEQEKLKAARFATPEGQKTISFWDDFQLERNQDLVLTPNLPNRFLAIVPSDFHPESLESVFNAEGWESETPSSEWAKIVGASWRWLDERAPLNHGRKHWDFQVRNFWQVSWQLWPWQEVSETRELFKTIPLGKESSLHQAFEVANAIPESDRDDRCHRNGRLDSGWAWSAHYQLLAHRHDARRQTRAFDAWSSNGSGHKDYFSGKEEVIATKDWLALARKSQTIAHLFRHDDELGAVNLIKRVWHKAYLEKKQGFRRDQFKFASVLSVAAASWRGRLRDSAAKSSDAWSALLNFQRVVKEASGILDFELPQDATEESWLKNVDASIFQESFWNNLKLEGESKEKEKVLRDEALAKLRELLKTIRAGQPGKYYAVIALDGDQIGKWLSGELTPAVESVITGKAAQYFRNHVKESDVKKWLSSPRPLSPSYHLQFSEALANFGLYAVSRIVEFHRGELIYSGGDDVLALVPAEEAIACAIGLRMAFQGSPELWANGSGYVSMFDRCPEGFIRIKEGDRNHRGRKPAEPSWPLLVPGPRATVSVGIAIGHIKEPLQDMIKEAQAAEQRAKIKYNRNANAVTLFKRSGELIEWGTSFVCPQVSETSDSTTSAALRLLSFVQTDNRFRNKFDDPKYQPPISGKFPYRLAELLEPYQEFETTNELPDYSQPKPITSELRRIAERETEWVISRQCKGFDTDEVRELQVLCKEFLSELEAQKRPLREFYHLFAIEAFIARQGE